MPDYVIKALFVLTGLLFLYTLLQLAPHTPRPFPRFLMSAAAGFAVLLMGNTAGSLFGVGLGLNAVTLPVAAGLGVPGVLLMWFLRYFM